jgi:hypothetical protein
MSVSEREPVRGAKVRFTLVGFQQDAGVRRYAFQGIADGIPANFTVGVDLALMVRFGIHIQDLPLLCRELLERQLEGVEERSLTLSESEMRMHADQSSTARETASRKKRATVT